MLRVNPTISADWPHCELRYRLPDDTSTTYRISIENPTGKQSGVASATLDGQAVEVDANGAHIPIIRDGREHTAVVTL